MAEQIALSPTRIRRWVRCKRSYYWRYGQKLVRIRKETPMSLGLVVGEALAGYYQDDKNARSQELMNYQLEKVLGIHGALFLGNELDKGRQGEWDKVRNNSRRILSSYHEWASEKDDFYVVMVEATHQLQLAPNISLLAIPDANVITPEELPLVFEHKVRYRYRPGDFGIDYQSVTSCIVSNAIGTLYNVLEYGKGKYHRELIIRSDEELNYFRDMFVHIGEDILSTPWDRMYPMPFKRCSCEYWELCNAEMQGLDVDDVISELYERTTRPKKEEPKEETSDNRN